MTTQKKSLKNDTHPAQRTFGVRKRSGGFSLIEILAVMTIMVSLLALATPTVSALKGAGDFTHSLYQVSGALEQARTYALANNTYVYVGFTEVDASIPGSAVSQISGTGKIAVMIAASKDGSRGYDMNDPASGWNAAGHLIPISKLLVLSNLHLADQVAIKNQGGMANRPALDSASYDLQSQTAATTLTWPLGGSQYRFDQVVQFDPQGVARIQTSNSGDSVPPIVEIALQESRGVVIPENAQEGAVQISGVSGAVRVYRQ